MGADARCDMTVNGRITSGRVLLETETIVVRAGEVKLVLPFKQLKKVAVHDGALTLHSADQRIVLHLGAAAERWAGKIRNPPSRLAKIGVRAGARVSAIGVSEDQFIAELAAAGAAVTVGRAARMSAVIFFELSKAAHLDRFGRLKASLAPDGALWTIRPKGHAEITERLVREAARAAGLVDVKVVAFSATHTAEKFVIPVASRPASSRHPAQGKTK